MSKVIIGGIGLLAAVAFVATEIKDNLPQALANSGPLKAFFGTKAAPEAEKTIPVPVAKKASDPNHGLSEYKPADPQPE